MTELLYPTITLCMIVRNEEKRIASCLNSVDGVVSEIIVIDTGSEDHTVEICKSNGADVYYHPWKDDFASARNFSLEKASGEWILWMDADEELTRSYHSFSHRLIRRSRGYQFIGKIHEHLAVTPMEKLPKEPLPSAVLLHYGYMDDEVSEKDKANRNM